MKHSKFNKLSKTNPGTAGEYDNANMSTLFGHLEALDNLFDKVKLPLEVSRSRSFYTARAVYQKTQINFGCAN